MKTKVCPYGAPIGAVDTFQGEQQPVYAEFGSILLLIIFAKHRFNMQAYDLGIEGPDSFVVRYLKNASMARSPDDLTAHEDVLLRGWIRGLFEAEGINDDLMSMCSPKEFHLLVATLFDQSLKACHAKLLAPETLKSGFECGWHLFWFFPLVSLSTPFIILFPTSCLHLAPSEHSALPPNKPSFSLSLNIVPEGKRRGKTNLPQIFSNLSFSPP